MHSRVRLAAALLVVATVLAVPRAEGAVTAFRLSDLDVRDPHWFVNFLGCRDVTDVALAGFSVNGQTQTKIQNDGDGDGKLDLSYILLFDDLNPAATTGSLRFATPDCTAPMASTTCAPNGSSITAFTTTQSATGTCLGTLSGTTRPYTPAVTASTGPCFVTSEADVTLDLGGIPITLRGARFGGTLVGNPVTSIANGLMRGFLTEADANNTIIPSSFPLIGGLPLSAVLPGGDRPPAGGSDKCCATWSDKDVKDGVPGWWFYFNFPASKVPWTETVSVPVAGAWPADARVSPNPTRGAVALSFTLEAREDVLVTVHDLQGRAIAELASGPREAGTHRVLWNGRDAHGASVSPGIYVLTMSRGDRIFTRHVALVR